RGVGRRHRERVGDERGVGGVGRALAVVGDGGVVAVRVGIAVAGNLGILARIRAGALGGRLRGTFGVGRIGVVPGLAGAVASMRRLVVAAAVDAVVATAAVVAVVPGAVGVARGLRRRHGVGRLTGAGREIAVARGAVDQRGERGRRRVGTAVGRTVPLAG